MFIQKDQAIAAFNERRIYKLKFNAKSSQAICKKLCRIRKNAKIRSMYIRYTAKYYNRQTNREETGIFRAADYVRDFSGIIEPQKDELQELIRWFDEHLPVPQFYDDPSKRSEKNHTYFWFKTSATVFIERMDELARILEDEGIKVGRRFAEVIAGKLVFEDECQIAVVPPENL